MKRIGITECHKASFGYYLDWIKKESDIEIIVLSPKVNNVEDVQKCDGIIFSGGADVHPKFYGGQLEYKRKTDFDEKRDEFEREVFQATIKKELPILGICRGMQYINLLMGGGLIQDLQEDNKNDHRTLKDENDEDIKDEKGKRIDSTHEIRVTDQSSLLYEVSKVQKGVVNSAHHQGLGKIADKLKVTAISDTDEVAEALEYKDRTNKPFFLCVQWHPERLATEDTKAFSENIRTAFLESIKK